MKGIQMSLLSTTKSVALFGVLLATVAIAAIACSSDSAESALTEAQMRSIVADAVAQSAPAPMEQVSASEIKSMVESAMPAPMEQVSASEIKSMVDSAMTGAMSDMSGSQVSASEIKSMVESAVSSAAMEGASPEEMQAMVESAVMAATADAASGAAVLDAISMAVMEAQEGQVSASEIKSMVESAVSSAAMEGATPEEMQAMVESAVMAATADAASAADVQAAVSMAVMESQAGMITTADVENAMSSAVMQAAENSLTAEEIERIVSKALEDRAMMEEGPPKETIVFSDLNWTSAQVQNRVAQYIVEHGYGYPTDVIFGATLPNFQGLQKGDIHVTLEIWLPNQSIGWEKAIEIGDVVSVGTSLVGDWQSTFVIPKYIADANPDLKTPQDLMKPEYQALFSSADSRGKARHVACVIGWSCEMVNTEQIETYGLADSLHVINPGSQEAMFAEIYAAFEKEEPWLGYMWGTGDPALKLDLVRLEEAPYTEECWDTDKACAFSESLVLVAVHESLLPRAPDVIGMLQNWEFTIDIYKSIFQWMDANPGSEASEAATWFLTNNNVWESWITPEAAARVKAALESEMMN